ncbi:MAG: PIN domain-containing protein [Bacteroidales bacterium]
MKDKLFLDTNVMLDLLGERIPHYHSMAKVASLADKGKVHMTASSLSYATVYYLLSKYEDPAKVKEKLRKFRVISEIPDLNSKVIEKGLSSGFSDFEDALQYHSALQAECTILLTRNGKDFKSSEIPVMTAEEYLIRFRQKSGR